jgi:cyclic pyranopterin phosphate synthase
MEFARGRIKMVDISQKKFSARFACARVRLCMRSRVLKMIKENALGKGDCLAAAQAAGILAAKNTAGMIPLCHPLPVSFVDISFSFRPQALEITSVVKTAYATGVEMEALCACAIAALTVYDMAKAYDKGIVIKDLRLLEKRGGKSGVWKASS